MQTPEQFKRAAADLYWLAFLLTGARNLAADLTIDVLESEGRGNSSSPEWALGWWKSLVIVKAVATMRDELAASMRRMDSNRPEESRPLPQNWVLEQDTLKADLARALLAIDIFPRCAVLLSVFEGLTLDDAAILVGSDRELVSKARMVGLLELTCNLASMQSWASVPAQSYAKAGEFLYD